MFARSVVLVLRHDDEGTIGVVLNRPTNLVPATIFPELKDGIGGYAGNLFRGGPIAPTRLLYSSAGSRPRPVNGPEVLDKVFLSIDDASLPDMTRLADGTNDLRLYAGHAAWEPGQLQARDQRRRLASAARERPSSSSTPIPAGSGRSSKAAAPAAATSSPRSLPTDAGPLGL